MPKRLTAIKIPAVSQSAAVRQLQRAVLRPQPQRAVLQLQNAASQLAARRPDAVVCVCRVSAAAPPRKGQLLPLNRTARVFL